MEPGVGRPQEKCPAKPAKEPGLFEERFPKGNARPSRYCSECADGIFKGKE